MPSKVEEKSDPLQKQVLVLFSEFFQRVLTDLILISNKARFQYFVDKSEEILF